MLGQTDNDIRGLAHWKTCSYLSIRHNVWPCYKMCALFVLVVHQLMDLHLSRCPWKNALCMTDRTVCDPFAAMNYVASVEESLSQLLPSPALPSRAPPRWPYPGPCCPPALIGRSELSHWSRRLTLSATGTRDSSATLKQYAADLEEDACANFEGRM